MAEETQKPLELNTPDFEKKPDWFLEEYVNAANDSEDFALKLTLSVKGTIISGNLIGINTYFRELGDDLSQKVASSSLDAANNIKEHFSKISKEVEENRAAEPDASPKYFHLRNTVIHMSGRLTPVGFWRGRLSEVDGFCFGVMQQQS